MLSEYCSLSDGLNFKILDLSESNLKFSLCFRMNLDLWLVKEENSAPLNSWTRVGKSPTCERKRTNNQ